MGVQDYYDEADSIYNDTISGNWYSDTHVNTVHSLAQQIFQNDYNAAEAEKAWQRQLDAIRMQNEYNSPVEQMKRYEEAGLNPLLLYGQISPGQQSSLAEYQAQRSADGPKDINPNAERFGRTMQTLSMIQSIFKSVADLQSTYEGLKTQQLQNDILKNDVEMSNMQTGVNRGVYNLYADNRGHIPEWDIKDMFQSVFLPALAKQDATYSKISYDKARTNWQNWYNDNFAPLLQNYESNKVNLSTYQLEFLQTMPPEMRQIYMLLLPLLKATIN